RDRSSPHPISGSRAALRRSPPHPPAHPSPPVDKTYALRQHIAAVLPSLPAPTVGRRGVVASLPDSLITPATTLPESSTASASIRKTSIAQSAAAHLPACCPTRPARALPATQPASSPPFRPKPSGTCVR